MIWENICSQNKALNTHSLKHELEGKVQVKCWIDYNAFLKIVLYMQRFCQCFKKYCFVLDFEIT